ncbi:MAG: MFS transporter [Syntrophobacter sp.]
MLATRRGPVPVRWRIAILLSMSYMVWFMDRVNISVAGPTMMKYFNWTAADFGLVQSAFFVGYAFTQIPGGWLADRFGGSKVVLLGTLWWSLFVFITPFGATLALMMAIRASMGVGEGVNAPAHVALTAWWMPKKESGRAIGVYYIGMQVGIMITMPLTVWIIGTYGWQMCFFSFAFVGVAWSALWYWYGCDRPEQHRSISEEELAYIKSDRDDAEVMEQPTDWKTLFTNKLVWGLAISYFFNNYLFYLYITWLPGYLVIDRGFTLVKTGVFAMLPYMVSIITSPLGGYLSDYWTKKYGAHIGRSLPIQLGLAGSCIFLVLGAYTSNPYAAVAYICASVGFLNMNFGPYWSAALTLSAKDGGVIGGLMNTLGTVAGIIAPAVTGFIVTASGNKFEWALYFGAFLALLGVIVIGVAGRVRPIEFAKPAPEEKAALI